MSLEVPVEVADELRTELLGAREEAERKARPYSHVAAGRVWDVIVGRPRGLRDLTLRRFGADAQVLDMVEGMLNDDAWAATDEWLAAVDPIVQRLEAGLARLAGDDIEDHIDAIARLLGWHFE